MGGVVRNPNRHSFSQKRKDPDWTLWRQTATTRRLCWHPPQSVDTMNTANAMAHIRPGAPKPIVLERCERYTLSKFRWCWIFFKGSLSLLGSRILFSCLSTSLGHDIKCEVWFLSFNPQRKKISGDSNQASQSCVVTGSRVGWEWQATIMENDNIIP